MFPRAPRGRSRKTGHQRRSHPDLHHSERDRGSRRAGDSERPGPHRAPSRRRSIPRPGAQGSPFRSELRRSLGVHEGSAMLRSANYQITNSRTAEQRINRRSADSNMRFDMKFPRLSLVLCLVTLVGMPARSYCQTKVRVAIWEFENHAPQSWWFYNDMGPAARNQIDTEFSENQDLSSTFTVVERDKLNLVMKEQGLGASGAVDPSTAAKVGKLLGVKYIIMGGIDKFNIQNTRGAVNKLGVGGNMAQSQVTINLRIVDTTSGERIIS